MHPLLLRHFTASVRVCIIGPKDIKRTYIHTYIYHNFQHVCSMLVIKPRPLSGSSCCTCALPEIVEHKVIGGCTDGSSAALL